MRPEQCPPAAAGPFNLFSHCPPAEGLPLRMETQPALRSCPCTSVLRARIGWDLECLHSLFLFSPLLLFIPSPPLPFPILCSFCLAFFPPISLSPCIFYFPLPPGQAWVKLDSLHPLLCLTPPDPMLAPRGWVLRRWLPQGSSSCRLQGGAGGLLAIATAWAPCRLLPLSGFPRPRCYFHSLQEVLFPLQSWEGLYNCCPHS